MVIPCSFEILQPPFLNQWTYISHIVISPSFIAYLTTKHYWNRNDEKHQSFFLLLWELFCLHCDRQQNILTWTAICIIYLLGKILIKMNLWVKKLSSSLGSCQPLQIYFLKLLHPFRILLALFSRLRSRFWFWFLHLLKLFFKIVLLSWFSALLTVVLLQIFSILYFAFTFLIFLSWILPCVNSIPFV